MQIREKLSCSAVDGKNQNHVLFLWWDPSAEFLFQAIGSLTSNAVSSVVAGAGFFLLVYSLVALRTASQLCDSEKEHLSSLPYSGYPNPKYEIKDCVLDGVSLTVSTFRLSLLSCEISVSFLHNLAFSAVPSPVGLNVWRQKKMQLKEVHQQTAKYGACIVQSQKRKSRRDVGSPFLILS